MPTIAQILLGASGVLIAAGGLYDILTPRLPSNLASICNGNDRSVLLVRQLLRALGGCLFAIGVTVTALATRLTVQNRNHTVVLILVLVLPSEGLNALGMYRVRSPFYIPLIFMGIALAGALVALKNPL